jgi:hypothetical protein
MGATTDSHPLGGLAQVQTKGNQALMVYWDPLSKGHQAHKTEARKPSMLRILPQTQYCRISLDRLGTI